MKELELEDIIDPYNLPFRLNTENIFSILPSTTSTTREINLFYNGRVFKIRLVKFVWSDTYSVAHYKIQINGDEIIIL